MDAPYRPAEISPALSLILAALAEHDRQRLQQAYLFVAAAHQGQTRDEGTPYIEHPVRVVQILWHELGYQDDTDLVIAALAHDVLEDSPEVTPELLGSIFGERVLGIVSDLTKPAVPREQREERDRAYMDRLPGLSLDSRLVKLADRIDNLRSVIHANNPAKAQRYLAVSRAEFLPLALATDATAARLISEACDAIERYLLQLESGS